jgi:hypothetical protein
MPLIKLNDRSIKDVTSFPFGVGNLIHIQSQTASNSASISFTTGINSTYKEYQFYFINIHPRTDAMLVLISMSSQMVEVIIITITSTVHFLLIITKEILIRLGYRTGTDLAQSTNFHPLTETIQVVMLIMGL